MREIDAPSRFAAGRCGPPQSLVIRRSCGDDVDRRRRRCLPERRIAAVRSSATGSCRRRRRRERRSSNANVTVAPGATSAGSATRVVPHVVLPAARRTERVTVGGSPRDVRRVHERDADADVRAGRCRWRAPVATRIGRPSKRRSSAPGVSSPNVPCVCDSIRNRNGAVAAKPHDSGLTTNANVTSSPGATSCGSSTRLPAVHPVRIVLDAPVVVVLRSLRGEEDIALCRDPRGRSGIAHRHETAGGLKTSISDGTFCATYAAA